MHRLENQCRSFPEVHQAHEPSCFCISYAIQRCLRAPCCHRCVPFSLSQTPDYCSLPSDKRVCKCEPLQDWELGMRPWNTSWCSPWNHEEYKGDITWIWHLRQQLSGWVPQVLKVQVLHIIAVRAGEECMEEPLLYYLNIILKLALWDLMFFVS